MDEPVLDRLFFEIHKNLPREGPGNDECTRRAFEMCKGLPVAPRVLDIGCGPGAQTVVLAKLTGGLVVAVDNHQTFLEQLKKRVAKLGLEEQIATINGDMNDLGFDEGQFNLVWSEGAIFIIGFEEGLRKWRRVLKPGGFIAVSELTRLASGAPDDIREYWEGAYPQIQDAEGNLSLISKAGYEYTGGFELPESAWFEDYYNPIEHKIAELRLILQDDADVQGLLDFHQKEIDMYREGARFYGYVFYVARLV